MSGTPTQLKPIHCYPAYERARPAQPQPSKANSRRQLGEKILGFTTRSSWRKGLCFSYPHRTLFRFDRVIEPFKLNFKLKHWLGEYYFILQKRLGMVELEPNERAGQEGKSKTGLEFPNWNPHRHDRSRSHCPALILLNPNFSLKLSQFKPK